MERYEFGGGEVFSVTVDYGGGLELHVNRHDEAEDAGHILDLSLGVDVRIVAADGTQTRYSPETTPSALGELIVSLRGAEVVGSEAVDSVLIVRLGDGRRLEVDPSECVEAWQVETSAFTYVCLPGGGVEYW